MVAANDLVPASSLGDSLKAHNFKGDNPLLDFTGLPRFAQIQVEHISPAMDTLLESSRATINALAGLDLAQVGWANFITPLFAVTDQLDRAWNQVTHLNAVINSAALREAYNANLPKITEFYTDLAQNEGIFERYQALKNGPAWIQLDSGQQRLIDNELRDFRLGGAGLPPAPKARFKAIQEELSKLAAEFEEHVLDATNQFALYIADKSQLAGLPDEVLTAAKEEAMADGREGWKFTLRSPSYQPVMQYAAQRQLRRNLYEAFYARASDLGPTALDNTHVIQRLLQLRQEEAKILGFANYAEASLATKMADSPEQVLAFLRDMVAKTKHFAEQDMAELRAFAREHLQLPDLEAWDAAYVAEKLREHRFQFSDHSIRQYFPEERVLAGLFHVTQTIFEIEIREATASTWHSDVRFFEIFSKKGTSGPNAGALIGQFYLDLYAREHKRGGAWMDIAINRRRSAGALQTPVAYLTCNFSGPIGDKPATFTHDEVITLFHEFGHGLHLLLTEVDWPGISGLEGVEWDAVELPSQFLENFCWEWEVLKQMTQHVETGEPLPETLFHKMLAAKNFHAGMYFVRQLEFALFDLLLHYQFDPQGDQTPLQLLGQVRQEVAVLFPPASQRFPHAFTHIFAGGYSAGYYSYLWAQVLSADAYSLFEEMRLPNRSTLSVEAGQRFRSQILARGGSRPALESFKAFRQREPQIEPLLRHNGMI